MSDEKEEKKIEPAPEQPLKKKKPEEKPEDKQASWSDHKQAELGEIPDKIKDWFESTKVGQGYKEARESFKEEISKGLQSGFGLAENKAEKTTSTPSTEQGKEVQEDDNALAPMTSAKSASSPIPAATELDKLSPSSIEPSPNTSKPGDDVNNTL